MNMYKKNLLGFLAATIALTGAMFNTGCTTTDGNNADFNYMLERTAAKTAVQYAVLEYIGDDEAKAEKIRKVALTVLDTIEGGSPVIVDALLEAAKSEIDFDKLDHGQKILVMNILELAKAAITVQLERVNPDLTDSEQLALHGMTVRDVIIWVIDATQLYSLGARA